jgi:hypothetical protein
MITGFQSIWFIQTLLVSGLAFYGTFRAIAAALAIPLNSFVGLDNDVILSTALVAASGIVIQGPGSALERIAFQ